MTDEQPRPADEPEADEVGGQPGPTEPPTDDPPRGTGVEEAVASAQNAAEAVKEAVGAAAAAGAGTSIGVDLPSFGDGVGAGADVPAGMGLLDDVALRVTVELGRTQMYVEDVLRLNTDSVIELDKAAGDPVDIYVNNRLVARGEVLVLNENFCVRVSEIVDARAHDE
jgi:flagellar motor switch protein FliN/FliY